MLEISEKTCKKGYNEKVYILIYLIVTDFFMRKLLTIFLEILVITTLFFVAMPYVSDTDIADNARYAAKQVKDFFIPPCSKPLRYSLGTIDPRFNLSNDQIRQELSDAEKIWESSDGRNLFEYDAQSELKINFVFDGRQQRTLASKTMEDALDAVTLLQKGISKEYDNLSDQYSVLLSKYKSDVKEYEKRAEQYAQDVEYWNSRGGAPKDEYERLQDEQKALNELLPKIEGERKQINALVKEINSLAETEQKAVEQYNQRLDTYKEKYGESTEFDKGIYSGNEINIYQFEDNADLSVVLAHELGHALGIDHVENSKSLMYYMMGDQDMNHPALSLQDIAGLHEICHD